MNLNVVILIWGISSLFLSLQVGRFLIKRADSIRLNKTNQSAVRFGSQTKPLFGGVVLYIVFMLSIILSLSISSDREVINQLFAFLLTGTIGFFIGLTDDLLDTNPFFKFLGQSLVAVSLIFMNITINTFSNPILNDFITFFWVIAIMNAINLLDNMDAVSGSVTIFILLAVLLMTFFSHTSNFPFIILLVGLIGALIGFLKYNWNPSKIYLGDNGSQFLGAILSLIGIVYFWNGAAVNTFGFQKSFWIMVLAFIVPLTDTTTVFINRLLRKQSPFIGGRDHTTHHLYYLGLSVKQVAVFLSFLTIISLSLSIYIINFVGEWNSIDTLIFGGYAVVIFVSIFSITKITKPTEQKT